MQLKLVVVGGEAQQHEYDVKLPAIIGRSRGADVKIGQPLVSRRHCELFEDSGQVMLRDLGSLNGTFIGDHRIGDVMPLKPNAHMTVGSTTFQAVYDGVAETETFDLPDFKPPALAANGPASTIENTMELPSGEEVAAHVTEPVPGAKTPSRDKNFDLGWLDEPGAEDVVQDSVELDVVPNQEPAATGSAVGDGGGENLDDFLSNLK